MFILVVQSLVINCAKTNNVNTYHDIKTYNKAFNLLNNICKLVYITLVCLKLEIIIVGQFRQLIILQNHILFLIL
jgi:hypothetical protein